MKMTKTEYGVYVKHMSPASKLTLNLLKSFVSGGAICCIGQAVLNGYEYFGLDTLDASTATSITLVFLGALLTGLKIYDKLAKFAGTGTLVPITGFANAVVSPALEFKSEGIILRLGAKMSVIAGPVIVYGIPASVVYGLILWLARL